MNSLNQLKADGSYNGLSQEVRCLFCVQWGAGGRAAMRASSSPRVHLPHNPHTLSPAQHTNQQGKTATDQMLTIFANKCGVLAAYSNLKAQYGK
jgi:hypothetical protein